MPTIDIVCLANSRKPGGRCVAGIRLDGGGWIRPVGPGADGTLYATHYTLDNHTEAALLDCVRVPVVGPRPEPHQPENWLVGADSWRLIGRVELGQAYTFLRDSLSIQGPLFGQPGDRIAHAVFAQEAARASLVLIEPSDLRWQITTRLSGRRQTRARFAHADFQYDLSVTDPRWEAALAGLGLGTYHDPPPGVPPAGRSLLTVSLGEPFDGNCYKLVAAVIRCP